MDELYKKIVEEARGRYDKLERVYCPCIKTHVVFNARGFYHLRYHTSGRGRGRKEQIYKLNLLPLATPVIKNAKNIHFYEQRAYVTIGRKKGEKKPAEYWALIGVVGKQKTKVKVILRRVGTGNIIFWSIMKIR